MNDFNDLINNEEAWQAGKTGFPKEGKKIKKQNSVQVYAQWIKQ